MTTKDSIVFFEDDNFQRTTIQNVFERLFPDYKIITHAGGHESSCAKGCVDDVVRKLEGNIDRVAVVCTDGNLSGSVSGWDVVVELRKAGYNGPAIYLGGTDLPPEIARLYVKVINKGAGAVEELIPAIRQELEK